MAITIEQDIDLQPYPAFNDSYIRFSSSINPTKAEIQIANTTIFPNPFIIYPDPDGYFLFNFREVAKASFSKEDFEHEGVTNFVWGQSFLGNLATVNATIRTYSGSTSDSLSKSYSFSKSVRQVGEEIYEQYILSPQTDPITYELTYWEGYPFNFQIQSIPVNDGITVKNLNSGVESSEMTADFTGGFAIHIDKVTENWTVTNFLPLFDTVNRLEVYEEGEFKCNVNLIKKKPCKGVYVRWFNDQGGISFHLFDEFYRDTLQSSTINTIASNSFANVGSLVNPSRITGKEASTVYRVKTTVNRAELKVLKQIYTSPRVEMYTSHEPFVEGEWVDVELTTRDMADDTKKDRIEVTLTFLLPTQKTLML